MKDCQIATGKKKAVIGLTGKYCAGKNHVARLLERRSFPVLDLDKLGHEAIETEKQRIVFRFGEDVLGPDGLVNRKLLGSKVFGKPIELAALEDIVHPTVNRETLAWINACSGGICFINAALLHRSSAFDLLDAVIIVEAPFVLRLLRAKRRDGLPWMALLRRFGSQKEIGSHFFTRKTDIYRVGSLSGRRTEKRIDEILSRMGLTRV